ncbi:MAG: hypothetical protein NVS9B11_15300 [Candidatus Dormibacteraceae bacterium]
MRVLNRPFLGLLGPPSTIVGPIITPLDLQPKTLAVLAYAAMAERPVSRLELSELLFPEAADPRGSLRWHLARLRVLLPRAVRDGLVITQGSVALTVPTDAAAFRRSANACLARFEPTAARAALALYRGEFLSGLSASGSPRFDNWLFVLEGALHSRFRRLVLAFAGWAIDRGYPEQALGPLTQLIESDPYVEDAHALRIRALAAAGSADRARGAFDQYARIVRDELHAEPRAELAQLVGREAPKGQSLPVEGFVTLDEVTLHTLDWTGGDPPIVALHGAVMSGYVFSALAHHLTPEFRLIAPAIRGNGFSDKPPDGYTAERHVRDLLELIDALGIHRPVLMGHSTGGTIATLLAERCQARALILLDAVVGSGVEVADRFRAADHIVDASTVPLFDLEAYLTAMRERRAGYAPEAERLLERLTRMHLTRMPDGSYRGSVEPYAVRRTWESLVRSDSLGALGRVRCPVLVVWAKMVSPHLRRDGPYLDEQFIRRQVRAPRRAQLIVAERSDHASLIRDPDAAVLEGVRLFLRSLAKRGPATAAQRASGNWIS